MIQNNYVQPYEIKKILSNIQNSKKDDLYLIKIINSIYHRGLKPFEAINKFNPEKTIRTLQRKMIKYSNGKINLRDLRRSFKFSNPSIPERGKYDKERGKMTLKLRWMVLSRDSFRCVSCGISSKEKELHIDHIKPICLGGKTELKNLQTLCRDCNLGKKGIELDVKDKQNQQVNKGEKHQ